MKLTVVINNCTIVHGYFVKCCKENNICISAIKLSSPNILTVVFISEEALDIILDISKLIRYSAILYSSLTVIYSKDIIIIKRGNQSFMLIKRNANSTTETRRTNVSVCKN